MKIFDIDYLDTISLKEINGGDQQAYNEGYKIGEALRKTLIFATLLSWFI